MQSEKIMQSAKLCNVQYYPQCKSMIIAKLCTVQNYAESKIMPRAILPSPKFCKMPNMQSFKSCTVLNHAENKIMQNVKILILQYYQLCRGVHNNSELKIMQSAK